jgi:hypothetical protein
VRPYELIVTRTIDAAVGVIQAVLKTGAFAWANVTIVVTVAVPHASRAILLAFKMTILTWADLPLAHSLINPRLLVAHAPAWRMLRASKAESRDGKQGYGSQGACQDD